MAIQIQRAESLLPVGAAPEIITPARSARDPALTPGEKLARLRALADDRSASATMRDRIAIHRAIFDLYDRHRGELRRAIYE